jgi:hypothetical protein
MEGARTQAAMDYGVQMIPSNFLLDQHGVIIGTKPFGLIENTVPGEIEVHRVKLHRYRI